METIQAHDHLIYLADSNVDFFKDILTQKDYSSIFVLVDSNTETFCLPVFLSKFPLAVEIEVISIEAEEENKHLQSCLGVWETLSELGGDRKSLMINLGGGVVTDLGGFVASTFKRGIDFINIPTTLLSMVDASVGGKTGVDLGSLKNQVGTICNPQAVIIYPEFLETLPANEYRSGYAEMLKHGLIQDLDYWHKLIDYKSITTNQILTYIKYSVNIKQNVVSQDPKENSLRKILNFGHTLGHAIESHFLVDPNKSKLLHGEAIAIGMIMEAYISSSLLGMLESERDEIKETFTSIYPKVDISPTDQNKIIELLAHDKKNSHGKIKFALLEKIGKPKWDVEVPTELFPLAFQYYLSA